MEAGSETTSVNTIRTLSIDAIQKANSGHPGTPMAMAPVAYVLWQRFLRFDPSEPIWPNRDRFILSAGHASMLLYAMLHLAQVKAVDPDYEVVGDPAVSLDDIRSFRQLDSRAPGHPEYRWTSGVETTTGPLGQGIATSIGIAIASRWLGAHYNRPDFDLFGFDVYALAGDGCLMEGVSHEAASIAGHQGLANLCWIYDNNHISIDGNTNLTYSDDVPKRFEGYNWNVVHAHDANDLDGLAEAFDAFKAETERPTLVIVDSHIGWGSPHKQDTAAVHGEPLGEAEVRATKKAYGWPEDAQFLVPDGVYEDFENGIGKRGADLRTEWEALFAAYAKEHPTEAIELERMQRRELPDGWDADLPTFELGENVATRKASNAAMNAIAAKVPWFLAGSADLTGSTSVELEGGEAMERDEPGGRQLHLGIREHGSAAAANGLALAKLRPSWSTYLTFSDYARPAIRLSTLMELPVVHIFTHDSIGLGEDGPTHQPVEQLASLRAVPGLNVIRPADANEAVEAWRVAVDVRHGPTALVLTRQGLPVIDRTKYGRADGLRRGGYVLADPAEGDPRAILIATGSEVALALEAHEQLAEDGVATRVVSLPSWHLFDKQDAAYRESVLPSEITARVSVEEASTLGWERYAGSAGTVIGMHTFGSSAPLKDVTKKFGFTPERVADSVKELL